MRKFYYYLTTVVFFLAYVATSAQPGCSSLEITATQDGAVCGAGSVTLEATPSGTGDDVFWFDAATGGNMVGQGEVFQTSKISSTTSYWATEALLDAGSSGLSPELIYYKFDEGSSIVNHALTPVGSNPVSITGTGLTVGGTGLSGTALEGTGATSTSSVINTGWNTNLSGSFTIGFWTSDIPPSSTLYYIFGDAGANSFRCFTNGVAGANNWMIRGLGLPDLDITGAATMAPNYIHVVYDETAGTYKSYVDGVLNTTVNVSGTPTLPTGTGFQLGGYSSNSGLSGKMDEFRVYDRALSVSEIQSTINGVLVDIVCESPRVEAIATVNNLADEDIVTLPYTHTANTSSYDNNYAGEPGDDCGTDDAYLYGYDVVYKYTADDDYILQVDLINLSEGHTGIFVYEDCADIGDECAVEGSVNTAATNHGFQMSVVNGNDYYFVVSSAEPTDSFDYTLTINGTTCANYPAPIADATQDYVDGQMLSDLSINGINLTWYSDTALTNVLPDDTPLVDNTTYYVTQTFQTCESAYAAITVNEVACTALDVVTTIANSVCGEGSVTLTAEGAEAVANTQIYWYDAAINGNLVGRGDVFETGPLEETTSFWAVEVALSGGSGAGSLPTTYCTPAPMSSGCNLSDYIDDFILEDSSGAVVISHLGTGCAPGAYGDYTGDSSLTGNLIAGDTYSFEVTHGTSSQSVRIWIDYDANGSFDDPGELVFESPTSSGNTSTPTTGTFQVPQNIDSGPVVMRVRNTFSSGNATACTQASAYGEVHDYKINLIGTVILCESDRVEVIAEVNDVADEMVTEPLPYVHTANTSDYGNNYFGTPGSNCTTDNYLDGNDVVYQFSPTVGGVFSIELSGLSSSNAGVFVYKSCYNIGSECYIGEVSAGTSNDFGIDEVIMNDGEDYFIVVSTKTSSSTAYTITIDEAQINCADYTAAPQGDADQFSEIGNTLADLDVSGSNLTWYSDAALTNAIPDTTPTVDGAVYYVTQTLNGCVSNALEITVHEVDCSSLEIVSTVGATIVCKGSATLEAQGSGTYGAELYWFDAAVDGNLITIGDSYTTPEITQSKSYWVTEVFVEQGSAGSGPLPTYCTPIFSYGCGVGDSIDDFILEDNSGTILISHLGTGCSTNDYGDFTGDASLTANLVAGATYNFEATHGTSSQYVRIWIDLDGNGDFEDAGELVYESTSAGSTSSPTLGSFEIPQNITTRNTVMRVKTTWSTGTSNSCTQTGSYGEAHDYKVTLIGSDVVCESPRVEVIAEVTQDGNEIVGTLPYTHSENTGTYGNNYTGVPGTGCGTDTNYLNGSDVVYMYEATDDDLITIELTDLNEYYAGVFVYEVCGEIGDQCAAGAVAGPSTNDVIIQDFPVVDGQTYYIVVSSWLTTDIDYTIKINSFSCADLETPTGDTTQNFVAGDTVDDLEAEGTRSGAVLTWYEDAALSIEITDTSTHLLVDGDTYYVTQTYNECESPALAITAEEIDCSNLEIVSFTDAEVACRGSVELQVVASGTGSEVYWYDAATEGNLIGMGRKFTTPELTQTTSYWAAEVYTEQGGGSSTGPLPTYCTPTFSYGCGVGDSIDDFILKDSSGSIMISHLGTGCSPNDYGDYTGDPSLTANLVSGATYNFEATHGTSSQYVRIWIDFDRNGSFEDAGELVYESTTAGSTANPTLGSFEIPQDVISGATVMRVKTTWSTGASNSCTQSGSYGEAHDYKITLIGAEVVCESPRQEVVATVNQSGDIEFDYTDLTYVDANNTSIYGNNFTGDAGAGCDGANYLNGSEAMYYYTANPTDDDILRIEVSNFSNPNTAVFVYDSCGDVGIDCLAGATNDGGEIVIEDYYVNAGDDLLIVVTSSTGSTDYTLTVEGLDCNNVAPPTGDAAPFFATGDVVSDLQISGSSFNDGFRWYSDAALTNEIIDPTTETLVDGISYYVTQTILGCESSGFEIIPIEFDCGLMSVLVEDPVYYVCAPGGTVSVPLTASGLGSEIYWYDQQTGGNIIGMGEDFFANVTESTSFWVSEVFTKESSDASGPLPTYCTPVPPSSGCNLSDYIDDFILKDMSGTTLISNLNTGCSGASAYVDYTNDPSLTATMVAGGTYNFEVTHGTSGQYVRIWIDYNGNGSFEDAGELVFESTTSSGSPTVPTTGSFQLPQNLVSGVSVMRVRNTFSTGTANSCSQSSSYGEVHDYKVILIGSEVVCESPREEIRVVMNEDVTPPPVVTPKQTICGESLLSEIIVLGTDIRWYNSNGTELSPNSPVIEGYEYYVTQTIRACESAMIQVIMDFTEKSDKPVAAINQAFEAGQDLTDLEVFGDNLNWYADKWKVTPIPSSTLLSDQTTYYVTQTLEDMCESETLGITVHEILDIKDVLFEAFEFYPNPVDEVLFITNAHSIDQVDIYDLAGRKVYSSKYHSSSIEVDVTSLSTGTYLLKATVDDMEKIFRVIKK